MYLIELLLPFVLGATLNLWFIVEDLSFYIEVTALGFYKKKGIGLLIAEDSETLSSISLNSTCGF